MTTHALYTSYQLGNLTLNNRCVMAPLTRNRANEKREPVDLNVTYYEQRATAVLIIAEATQICPEGQDTFQHREFILRVKLKGGKK